MPVLRQAIRRFGTPTTILPDNGSCLVGVRRGNPKGSWKPTAFEEIPGRGIELINTRPYHPRTIRKLERFHRTTEEEIGHYESLPEYIEYYERRLHFSLDIANYETPLKAFSAKKARVRATDPNRMEAESNDWRHDFRIPQWSHSIIAPRILSRPPKKMSAMATLIPRHSVSTGLSCGVWGVICVILTAPFVPAMYLLMCLLARAPVLSARMPTFPWRRRAHSAKAM